MRRFRDIIEDIKAPSVQDLWLNGGKLKYYGEKGWTPLNDTLPAATKTTIGGVKAGINIVDIANPDNATAPQVAGVLNTLLGQLRACGILIP